MDRRRYCPCRPACGATVPSVRAAIVIEGSSFLSLGQTCNPHTTTHTHTETHTRPGTWSQAILIESNNLVTDNLTDCLHCSTSQHLGSKPGQARHGFAPPSRPKTHCGWRYGRNCGRCGLSPGLAWLEPIDSARAAPVSCMCLQSSTHHGLEPAKCPLGHVVRWGIHWSVSGRLISPDFVPLTNYSVIAVYYCLPPCIWFVVSYQLAAGCIRDIVK